VPTLIVGHLVHNVAKSTDIPNFSASNICINQRKDTQRKNTVWSTLFWDLTERGVVILYGRFETSRRSPLQGLPMKMGPIGCPETSVQIYLSTLRKTQKSAALIYIAAETW